MRFSSLILDRGSMEAVSKVVASVCKLSKEVVMIIAPGRLAFSQQESLTSKSHRLWCQLMAETFFDEFRMEGLRPDANKIFLEFQLDKVNGVLKSMVSLAPRYLRMRLTKQGTQPCLSFECRTVGIDGSRETGGNLIKHDVPVDVLAERHWPEYLEPQIPKFHRSLYLPNTKTVQKVIAALRNMGNHVTVSANGRGSMAVVLETDLVLVETHFRGLERPHWTAEGDQDPEEEVHQDPEESQHFCSVRVDAKTLAQFFSSQQSSVVAGQRIICNIVKRRLLHFYIANEEIVFHYFLPAVSL